MTVKTGLCPYMDAQDQMNQHKQTSWDWHVADREGGGQCGARNHNVIRVEDAI